MRWMDIPRPLVIAALVLALLTGSTIGKAFLLSRNTLYVNDSWISTKMTLDKAVMGAVTYVTQQQSLARNRVDLSAYFGYQEILHREPVELRRLAFRFRLEPGAVLHAIFGHDEIGFSGVRFVTGGPLENAAFGATTAGRFTSVRPLDSPAVAPDVWHRVELLLADGRLRVRIDEEEVGDLPIEGASGRVGFRGAQRQALVDDVAIEAMDGHLIEEDFANHSAELPIVAASVSAVIFASILLATGLRRRLSPRDAGFAVVLANGVLLVLVGLAYVYLYWTGSSYRVLDAERRLQERYWVRNQTEQIVAHAREHYAVPKPDGATRILFLGSSQTWGAGASRDETCFVARIERALSDSSGGRVECVNIAVSGMRGHEVADLFESEGVRFEPDLVVLNLSNNDTDPVRFGASLERIVAIARDAGLPMLFVLEPNSPEFESKLGERHAVMREVAEKTGIPVLDMHSYLGSRYGAGLLWWDFVHLTDFGHELFAERMTEMLEEALAGGVDPIPRVSARNRAPRPTEMTAARAGSTSR